MTSHTHYLAFKLALFGGLFISPLALAEEQTYLREYTYQASEADSKITARAIALQEVKRLLLSELGTHVSSLVQQQRSSDGKRLDSEQIETLSAGVTRVEILTEKWDGSVYVLKAQIKADPADVLRSLEKMLDTDKKQKQVAQLGGELEKMRGENLQMAESLEQNKKAADAAMAEIARLKEQLKQQQTDAQRQTLQTQYQQQAQQLTLQDMFDAGWKKHKERDFSAAFALWRRAAEQGFTDAQNILGAMYGLGRGVPQDDKQSVYWYRKAAEQGDASAQRMLGLLYGQGKGVPQDFNQAVFWSRKAAEQGFAPAQYALGVFYDQGKGVPQDFKQAAFWYGKATEQGHASSQFNLGAMYAKGEGVPQDFKQAAFWYRKAAEQGDAIAQRALGLRYQKGEGVPQDFTQAVIWYRKAAEQGLASAQSNLGVAYVNGKGVPQDFKQAVFWFRKAAEQGDKNAIEALQILQRQ
jgi:TPR repeat protein